MLRNREIDRLDHSRRVSEAAFTEGLLKAFPVGMKVVAKAGDGHFRDGVVGAHHAESGIIIVDFPIKNGAYTEVFYSDVRWTERDAFMAVPQEEVWLLQRLEAKLHAAGCPDRTHNREAIKTVAGKISKRSGCRCGARVAQLLKALNRFRRQHGHWSPSISDLCEGVYCWSRKSVQRSLKLARELGYLTIDENQSPKRTQEYWILWEQVWFAVDGEQLHQNESEAEVNKSRIADMETVPLGVVVSSNSGDYSAKMERVFADAAQLLKGILQDLHCTNGLFAIRPISQVKSSARWSRIHVRGESTHNRDSSFHVRIRPGDNATTWEYVLTVPSGMSAAVLQEQLRLFSERCKETDTAQGEPEGEPAEAAPVVEDSPAVPTPEILPQTGPAAELGNLFQRIQSALVRKESRAERHAGITRAIDAERKKIEHAEARIARLEEDWLAVQQEDESDSESKEAEALLGTLRLFAKPAADAVPAAS